MDEIRNWIELEGTGHWFFAIYPVMFLCLFIWIKGRRVRFLIPCLLISIVIINPLFYQKWDELGTYAYWRMLWVVPMIPVLATAIPSLTEKLRKTWIKGIIVTFFIGGIILSGTFLYNGTGGSFVEATNIDKLPEKVIQIADRLLEFNDYPRVVAQDPIGVYIRQYTGNIDTLFGRDIHGNILYPSMMAKEQIAAISAGDWKSASQTMLDEGYEYLVISGEVGTEFEYVDSVDDYGIYKPVGVPKVIKERNEQGQVNKVTTVDENGQAINCESGYSSISYGYDQNGFIIYEFYSDLDGTGVEDEKGIAGYRREYDSKGNITVECTLGADQERVAAYQNYAEIRREYKEDKIIKEAYYDANGNPAIQPGGYYAIIQEWDNNNLISRIYLDQMGVPSNRSDGYSKVTFTDRKITFYDIDGNEIPLKGKNLFIARRNDSAGWSEWITPTVGMKNFCYSIGSVMLGEKNEGDTYSCQVEIEFKGVSVKEGEDFYFCTQGTTDGRWDIGNIWSHFVWLNEAPKDGVYRFTGTKILDKMMSDADIFEIAFRCDNWASGSFRIKNVKIEKNEKPSIWTPGY